MNPNTRARSTSRADIFSADPRSARSDRARFDRERRATANAKPRAKAKRVVYLFHPAVPRSSRPSIRNRVCAPSTDNLCRIPFAKVSAWTGMSGNQAILPLAASFTEFKRYGASGIPISDLLPETAKIADKLCVVNTMFTEAINHDPAITFFCTGSQQPGRPSMGSWLSYGLGTLDANLPAFIVLSRRMRRATTALTRVCGATVSCRASTKACSFAPVRSPCST